MNLLKTQVPRPHPREADLLGSAGLNRDLGICILTGPSTGAESSHHGSIRHSVDVKQAGNGERYGKSKSTFHPQDYLFERGCQQQEGKENKDMLLRSFRPNGAFVEITRKICGNYC